MGFLFGFVGALVSLIGWFSFHSVILLIVGTALYLVEPLMEWGNLNAGAKMLDIFIFIVGCLIAKFFTSVPLYVGGMIAIAIYGLIISLFSLIPMLLLLLKR